MVPGVSRNNKSQWAPQLFHPAPAWYFLYCALIFLERGESWPNGKNDGATSEPWTGALVPRREQELGRNLDFFFLESFRFDCVDVKSFLIETYVPQLVKVICKSIFLPLEREYCRRSESVIFHHTAQVPHRFHDAEALFELPGIVCSLMEPEIQIPGTFLWGLTLCSQKYDLYFIYFSPWRTSVMIYG